MLCSALETFKLISEPVAKFGPALSNRQVHDGSEHNA